MTYGYGACAETTEIADDAKVLITISSSAAAGMIRRWGVVSHAIGSLSVEALMRGAVDHHVVDLLRQQRPQQYEGERDLIAGVRSTLESGYRVFVHDANSPIDSACAGDIAARSLLGPGNPEGAPGAFYVLHLKLEPYGEASPAGRRDEAAAASAGEALCLDMAATGAAPAVMAPPALAEGSDVADLLSDVRSAATDEPSSIMEATTGDGDVALALAADDAPAIEYYVAQPKVRLSKTEALAEQFRPKVAALDFRGLFVGNFGFHRDTVVDVSRLSELSPQTISAYLMKANALRQSGDHEKALSYYRVLLKSAPDNADYRFLYGKTLMEMGRTQLARECFERARELGHDNAARELEALDCQQAKKAGRSLLHFWRRAEASQ